MSSNALAAFMPTLSCLTSTRAHTQWVAARLAHRSALAALNRWRDYACERQALRSKAQGVLKHMLLRRLYAGFW